MIDGRPNDPSPQPPSSQPQPPLSQPQPGPPPAGITRPLSDLYTDLFAKPPAPTGAATPATPPVPPAPRRPAEPAAAAPPRSPSTLKEAGLTLMQVCDLILKLLYLQGNLLGMDIARQMRLPFNLVDEGLRFLKDEKCIEVASGDVIGSVSYSFNLTDLGRVRAREAFEQCRYVGPAPVPLEAYVAQCRQQMVTGTTCTREALVEAFRGLIIRDGLLEELGPAVCSGKSIFVYGPPGNGKTMIARGLGALLNTCGREIFVPYAVHTDGHIITVFDPTLHQATDQAEPQSAPESGTREAIRFSPEQVHDRRWRRIRRPVVITGGELTLEMLDLRYNRTSNFYTAPLHIKANGGVFLIDDFGRQIVSPRDLLNRWILPLEERIDYLTLATGKKFSVPFEQLIIFSTNLDPRELVDEAFLRRIRHKILVGPPDREHFTAIFRLCCHERNIAFEPGAVEFLYENYYDRGKPPRSSDPRDLLEIVQSICRFRNVRVHLSDELMAEATQRFFCQI